jgi:hypothetical protein
MSADNWGICPRCHANGASRNKKAPPIYGQATEADYIAYVRTGTLPDPPETDEEYKLREDYEVYTNEDGLFTVAYSCACGRCGFSFAFKHKERIHKSDA